VTSRWQHRHSPISEFEVRLFHDRNRQYDAAGGHDRDESIETSDVEFQHRLRFHSHHDLVWGGGFRHVRDRLNPALDSWFSPNRFTANTTNAFVQDEIALFGGQVRATGGSKFEWNAFFGAELQPTARLLWLTSPAHTVWTAVSRAVRVPARIEMDMFEIKDVDIDDDEVSYELVIPGRRFARRPSRRTKQAIASYRQRGSRSTLRRSTTCTTTSGASRPARTSKPLRR
jgi:hypothetical protein